MTPSCTVSRLSRYAEAGIFVVGLKLLASSHFIPVEIIRLMES
jgi:hypothetical protein